MRYLGVEPWSLAMLHQDVLFCSQNIKIRHVVNGASGIVVVTFNHVRLEEQSIDSEGFAENWLKDRLIDGIYVTCRGDDWYQYPEFQDLERFVSPAAALYERRIAYGSSMGGYAAIFLTRAFKPTQVLAFSPQFSIDRSVVPFETRWARQASKTRFLFGTEHKATCPVTIVFDPTSVDALHVQEISRHVAARPVPLRHAGHTVLRSLAEMELTDAALQAMVRGEPDLSRVVRAYRSRRSSSPSYFLNLALRGRFRPRKIALARRALRMDPARVEARYHLVTWLAAERGFEEAEQMLAELFSSEGMNGRLVTQKTEILNEQGRFEDAILLAREYMIASDADESAKKILGRCLSRLAIAEIRRGERRSAHARFSEAARLVPENPWYPRMLAKLNPSRETANR